MSASDNTGDRGFRHQFRQRLNRFRRNSPSSSKHSSKDADDGASSNSRTCRDQSSPAATNRPAYTQNLNGPGQPTTATTPADAGATPEAERGNALSAVRPANQRECASRDRSGHVRADFGASGNATSLDLWSAAYREAVDSLGKGVDIAILKGENIAQLFKQLERMGKDAAQESAFLRGVNYLHSLQVPLERFKLALDLAAPLTSIEPTTSAVFGVVQGVTAIAISFSTADLDFAKQIGEMLEQLSYIDDCDTLGQRTNKEDIHQALVLVYQKLLEFYNVAFEMLTRRGVKLVMRMVLENGRLPDIVSDFLRHADLLRKLVEKATWEIVEDIRAMLYDCEIASWLGSGKMNRQGQHHAHMQEVRADNACEFLLANADFIAWCQATDSQRLAIVGEMGSGKSVAMSFLIDELRGRNERQLPQPKICYHYCQNGETSQVTYVLSVLIMSLLEQLPGLKRAFFEWYKRNMASGTEPATSYKVLEGWLQNTLATLDRPIIFVIDALDECDRQSRDRILSSLKTMAERAPRLKILLSSRPEEEILEQLDGVSKIAMGSDAARDHLIVEKTVSTRLFYLADDVKALVTEALSRTARGSAIWTRMTVELIEARAIKALRPMQIFLDNMPQPRQLAELYANLFSRYTSDDPENQRVATAALEVLSVARRPLSILELAWAATLAAAQDHEEIPTVDALSKLVDHQRVMSLILPFVAHVDFGDIRKRQVKLAHQSVKEFIIGSSASGLPTRSSGPADSAPSASLQAPTQQSTERLEAGILAICIRYLLLREINDVALFSEEITAFIEELPQDFDLFKDDSAAPKEYDGNCSWEDWEESMVHYDPTERGFGELFVYAACYWNDHFGAVSSDSPSLPAVLLKDVEVLCSAGSTRLHNWTAQNCRPDSAVKPRFTFDGSLYDPLSITALYGSESMLWRMLEESDLDGDASFLPNPLMGAADHILKWGELPRLRMLWKSRAGGQIRNLAFFRMALKQWSGSPRDKSRQGWDVVFGLIDDVYDVMVEEQWGSKLLSVAAGTGCLPVVRRLMEAAEHQPRLGTELLDGDDDARSRPEHGLIGAAVLGNHADVVEYLLGSLQGVEAQLLRLQCRSSSSSEGGENVLHLAARLCNPAIFRLLVPRLREYVSERDKEGCTVLVRIVLSPSASEDRCESARILLSEVEAGDDGHVDGVLEDRREALSLARRLCELDMCRVLDQ